MTMITIKVRTTGQYFGCYAELLDTISGRKLAETETVRPYGFRAAAYADGETLAAERGWRIDED